MRDGAHEPDDTIKVGNITASKAIAIGEGATAIYNEAAIQGVVGLHQLPPPPPDFIGRAAELAQLLHAIESGGVSISAVRGQGGIGKTALVLKLAETLIPRYPDAQFFLDLRGESDSPLTPAEALSHVIRAYHPTAKLPPSESELRPIYLSVLHEQHALVLLDNARDAAQVQPLIPPANCLLLVTSRNRFTLPGLRPCDLDEMPPADAVKLVREIAPRAGARAGELAALCGHLPLALRLTASLLAERADLSVDEVLRRLRDTQKRLALTGMGASLRLSYDLLTPEMRERWRILFVFPAPFDRVAVCAIWPLGDEEMALDALSDLVKASLLNYHEGRYWLHDLSRDFAHAQCSAAEVAEARRYHAGYYKDVLAAANRLYLRGNENILKGLALFDAERAHIEAGQRWSASPDLHDLGQSEASRKPADLAEAAARLCDEYPNAGFAVLGLRLHPRERIRWLEEGLRAARQLENRRSEGYHLGNLGLAYADLGEMRQAIKYHEEALRCFRKIGDRRGVGTWLGNLGAAYDSLGEARKAIEAYQQALAIAREEGDRRGEGAWLGNLGLAHAALGERHRAIELYEQYLAIAREIGDRHGEGIVLGNLGNVYAELREERKAIGLYEQSLVISREIGDRRGEGKALGNLGNAHVSLGDAYTAMGFYEQALVIARETGDRPGEGTALWNIAIILASLGRRAEAIAHAQASLDIKAAIEDPWTERVRRQLAEWQSAG